MYTPPMKKILVGFILGLAFGVSSYAFADDATSSEPHIAAQDAKGQLVDLASSRMHDDLEDVKRRVGRLEQDLRFLDQKVDSIARDVEDIRRRHLR